MILLTLYFLFFSFLIGIHSMQGWIATMRWGTRSQERQVQKKKKKKKKNKKKKKKKKKKKHTGNLFLKSLQFEGVC